MCLNGPAVGDEVAAVWSEKPHLTPLDHARDIIGLAGDQIGVGALPSEVAVEAGDARRRRVAPARILESLRGKIERPSAIRGAPAVGLHDDRHRPLYRSQRNILFDQLAHARVACGIRGPAEDHGDDVLFIPADRAYEVVPGSLGVAGLDSVYALHLSEQGVVIVHVGPLIVEDRSGILYVEASNELLDGEIKYGLVGEERY